MTDSNTAPADGPPTPKSPPKRHRWLLPLLLGSLLLLTGPPWLGYWLYQRSILLDGASAEFDMPRSKWVTSALQLVLDDEFVARRFGPVVVYNLTDHKPSDAQMRLLAKCDQLEYLDLTELADEDMQHLSHLMKLADLKIVNSQITEVGCKHLVGKPRLDVLSLESPHLNDACLASIGTLDLESLELKGGTISEAGMRHLSLCGDLDYLTLHNVELVGNPFGPLATGRGLVLLDLRGSSVTDDMLAPLENMHSLEVLNLVDTGVSAEACARILEWHPQLDFGCDYPLDEIAPPGYVAPF